MKISPLKALTAILPRQIWIGLLLFNYRLTDLLVNVFLVVSAVTHKNGSTVPVGLPFPRLQQRGRGLVSSRYAVM